MISCSFIHLNKNKPDNHTVRLHGKDNEVLSVYKTGAWTEVKTDVAFYDLIYRNCMRFVNLEAILRDGMAKPSSTNFYIYREGRRHG